MQELIIAEVCNISYLTPSMGYQIYIIGFENVANMQFFIHRWLSMPLDCFEFIVLCIIIVLFMFSGGLTIGILVGLMTGLITKTTSEVRLEKKSF